MSLINSFISHHEAVLINNVQKVYAEWKKKRKT